ncbi:MAG: hypothetical protein WCJ64_25930 [Rhodospirillaceae bacterium]
MTEDEALTYAERTVIRQHFLSREVGTSSIHTGFPLRRWAGGPNEGQPRLTNAIQSMLDRGLIVIVDSDTSLVAKFTNKGIRALKRSAADPRAFEHRFYWKLHAELAEVAEDL